ncbi:MAG: hypothetical protein AABZ06_06850 [Bdellovibrionota bacterium]
MSTNRLTVLIFKDNLPSKTFHVPFRWITHFGLLVSLLFAVAIAGAVFSIKFYRLARSGDPSRVLAMEKEMSELKAAMKSAQESRLPVQQCYINHNETTPSGEGQQNTAPIDGQIQ